MGVPGLFITLRNTYKSSFKSTKPSITHIYIDGNAMLYPIAEKTKNPKEIALMLCNTCRDYAKAYNCTISIWMDGPAHMAKIKQQRLRRFTYGPVSVVSSYSIPNTQKSMIINVPKGEIWSPAMFSPGTEMMIKIDNELKNLIPSFPEIIKYSSFYEPYEGEHKIIKDIKDIISSQSDDVKSTKKISLLKSEQKKQIYNELNPYSFAIIGKDADLLLLSMGCIETMKNIIHPYIIRHDDLLQKDAYKYDDPIVHVDCKSLRDEILLSMNTDIAYLKRNINNTRSDPSIWDFIIATFICGNDFLPPVPEFTSLRETINLICKFCPPLYINNLMNCYIDWDYLSQFLNHISQYVKTNMEWLYKSMDQNVESKSDSDILSIEQFTDFYYDVVHPFPVDDKRVVNVWYNTIGWNMIYYHDGIEKAAIDWQYPISFSPTLYSLMKYHNDSDNIKNTFNIANKQLDPLTPIQSLIAVLPIWLRDLIPNREKYSLNDINIYYPYKFKLSHYQEDPIIPIIPYEIINKIK